MRVIARFAERKSEGFNKADDLTAQLSGLPAHLAVGAPATQMERSVRKKCRNQQYLRVYGIQIYTGATDYLCLWITKSCTPTQNKIETCLSRVLDIRHLYS